MAIIRTAALLRDARHFQIAGLAAFLCVGLSVRAFDVGAAQIATILVACMATQQLGAALNAMRFDWKSPLITTLSLALLLRADGLAPLAAAGAIAVGSKFALRLNGKHVFNPANIGIAATVLLTDAAWTTPGQWGSALWLAAFIAGAGAIVAHRAARLGVPLIFLGTYAAALFVRALYLGDPLAIPLLRLQSGALVLFAFFMISDPKTTPDGARARAAFAAGAAILAYVLQYHFFLDEGLFYALALMSLVRPLMELFDPAPRYQWGDAPPAFSAPRLGPRKAAPRILPAE
ncbi:RnfABCDGE type electron transport complex subunit D [Amphiplicatus metriothermophilus]|uniref:NQR2, RnfD, RnfE family n=1 Tax=Amphiplicatus metriothermophilus TaxID=1519374 RepID=A0A239PY65_9PROT|nr:RnfABCDGE type electron transport complex subunit D [Amphiplicatus metriothermophilus]MBB5520007.1 Na+-transporting NADH:ubiquinone oxidoreductase subunit NqrB [Amphiplicatus metriothermophilus]SNT74906.1 NQR2, RnfD, RnfE family [Amphiplicatus metriothermophilus]